MPTHQLFHFLPSLSSMSICFKLNNDYISLKKKKINSFCFFYITIYSDDFVECKIITCTKIEGLGVKTGQLYFF